MSASFWPFALDRAARRYWALAGIADGAGKDKTFAVLDLSDWEFAALAGRFPEPTTVEQLRLLDLLYVARWFHKASRP